MTATFKHFHDVVPRLRLGVDFNVAELDDGTRMIVFAKCPQCGKRINHKRGFMKMAFEHPAVEGEALYSLHIPCGQALANGEPDRGTGVAVLGAVAAINEMAGTPPPDVLVVDDPVTLARGSGGLQ